MNEERNWKIVMTKPKSEKKVCIALEKKHIEHYCPINRRYRSADAGSKISSTPLFERYVFVNISNEEEKMVQVIDGIQHFIYWLDHPAIISNAEINIIRQFTSKHDNVRLEKIFVNKTNDTTLPYEVRTIQKSLDESRESEILKLLLPSLGYALVAEVLRRDVEVLNIRNTGKYVFSNFFTGSFR